VVGENEPFEELAQTVVSVAIWVVVPAVVGIARALRREAK
jgi:hypothetical protein